ncbi:ribosomal protein kinase, putative [Ixodes scapularis]|uniref:non-specific serine/threonine protein kinase n=1 Tax=Ixodes scapularis TaxID=6945 RepID=B7QBB8_IXOSC|nr:ribosomal protein kinase, putative [Ixodes scapularis]|eukprot:XP_002412844.1 ribosomal protein kinase, putative [Ixodes scapularis]
MSNFDLLRVLGTGAYGKVFLVRKVGGQDEGKLYAMKVLKKASIVQKQKTLEHTRTERQVLEAIRQSPFLVTLHYAFQTDAKLHLILGAKCIHKKTGVAYAVKIVTRRMDTTQEVQLLRLCQGHPNVVQFVEAFQDEAHTYLVLELLTGGELLERIRRRARFTESEACRIFRRLVSAVHYMHSRGVVHRDLKPENLLFTDSSEVATIKVVDFGFARFKPSDNQLMKTPCFTLNYAAPEVLRQASAGNSSAGYTESCDLWSLGVILVVHDALRPSAVPVAEPPRQRGSLMQRIREGEFCFDGPQWDPVSEQAKSVIRGLLTVESQARLTMAELRAHPWVHTKSSHWSASLMTPDVLSSSSSPRAAESALRATFDAFHLATRGGFRLLDVSAAPLAQRRRLKRNSADVRSDSSVSTSSGSSFTSSTSSSSSSVSEVAPSVRSLGFVPGRDDASNVGVDSVFTYPETKVAAYLSTLPDVVECSVAEEATSPGVGDDIEAMTVELATTDLAADVVEEKPQTKGGGDVAASPAVGASEQMPGCLEAGVSEPHVQNENEIDDKASKAAESSEIDEVAADAQRDARRPQTTRSLRKRRSPQESSTTTTQGSSDSGRSESLGEGPNNKKVRRKRSPPKQHSRRGRKQR